MVLSVLTFGYYQIFWFYKNWRFIKDRDGAPIYPWARALFAPLWFYALIDDVNRSQLTDPIGKGAAFGLSAAYFVVVGPSRSADPFWLTLFLSFFPILPLVRRINNFGGLQSFHLSHNSAWKARHFVLALFLGPWLVFTVASTVMLIPSTQVVDGWLVWGQSRNFLEESGVVEPGESILYFYGDGLFSFEEDGNLLTESRVISYWTDPASGEFFIENADFDEISGTETEKGSFTEPTTLTVTWRDGSEFVLLLSTESDRDDVFIGRLDEFLQ